MREVIATLTSKGQVTIPAVVRKHLAIASGNRVAFAIGDDGAVTLHVPSYPTIASLRGVAGSLTQPRSWTEMREIARADALERAAGDEAR